jgi:hypothetical protein
MRSAVTPRVSQTTNDDCDGLARCEGSDALRIAVSRGNLLRTRSRDAHLANKQEGSHRFTGRPRIRADAYIGAALCYGCPLGPGSENARTLTSEGETVTDRPCWRSVSSAEVSHVEIVEQGRWLFAGTGTLEQDEADARDQEGDRGQPSGSTAWFG